MQNSFRLRMPLSLYRWICSGGRHCSLCVLPTDIPPHHLRDGHHILCLLLISYIFAYRLFCQLPFHSAFCRPKKLRGYCLFSDCLACQATCADAIGLPHQQLVFMGGDRVGIWNHICFNIKLENQQDLSMAFIFYRLRYAVAPSISRYRTQN